MSPTNKKRYKGGNHIKIFSRIVTVATIVLLLLICGLKIPQVFGIEPMIVQSGSMEPSIHTGSVAFCDTKDKDIEVNDVITLQLDEGICVTHRVVDIKNNQVLTKGDANENSDGYRDLDMVHGTILFSIPKIGYLLDYLQGKLFRVIIGALIGLNIVSYIGLACFGK